MLPELQRGIVQNLSVLLVESIIGFGSLLVDFWLGEIYALWLLR